MAVSRKPLAFASATVAAPGTSVSPSSPVPDNCTGLSITNYGANPVLFATGTPGGALAVGTAGLIPAGASISLPIGTIRDRGAMDPATLAASGLIFDATGGGSTVSIVYICAVGGS